MQTQHVYLNGRIVPLGEAAISPFDIGLLRGYGVFDLLRTVGLRPFLLAEHLERLRASAARLGLSVPATDAELRDAIEELLARNGHTEATVRIVLTGGVSPDGMAYDPATPTLIVMTHDLHEPPATLYESGGALLTELHRREMPEAKTTNYLTMLRNKPRIAEHGALDVLYHDGEHVFEAASASVYFVKGGVVLAPSADVLHGTVGELVLGASETPAVRRGPVTLSDALSADEVFLTSTTRGVAPIVRIDGAAVGDGTVGPVTRDMIRRYRSAIERFAAEGR